MKGNIAHIKNLVVLAQADGMIGEKEIEILTSRAKDMGISRDQLDEWIKEAPELVLTIPEKNEDRENQLIEMITLANADGHFSQEEFDLCRMISEKLGYNGLNSALNKSMNRSHLKNLICLAAADGVIEETEMKVLKEAANNLGMTDQDLSEMLDRREEFVHVIPESEEERETQLIQMLSLAIADNEFTQSEYDLCKMVAEKLGFSETELKLIIKLSFAGQISAGDASQKQDNLLMEKLKSL